MYRGYGGFNGHLLYFTKCWAIYFSIIKYFLSPFLCRLTAYIIKYRLGSHGIEPTFLKLYSGLPGACFFSYYYLQCIKLDKRINNVRKTNQFYAYKILLIKFKKGVQSRVGFNSILL